MTKFYKPSVSSVTKFLKDSGFKKASPVQGRARYISYRPPGFIVSARESTVLVAFQSSAAETMDKAHEALCGRYANVQRDGSIWSIKP